LAAWDVVLLAPVVAWREGLLEDDPRTAEQVAAPLDLLGEFGPSLGRPLVDNPARFATAEPRGTASWLAEARYAAWLTGEVDR